MIKQDGKKKACLQKYHHKPVFKIKDKHYDALQKQ